MESCSAVLQMAVSVDLDSSEPNNPVQRGPGTGNTPKKKKKIDLEGPMFSCVRGIYRAARISEH